MNEEKMLFYERAIKNYKELIEELQESILFANKKLEEIKDE